jgi:aerobic carbon-monoxide dehydrogenase small subunit
MTMVDSEVSLQINGELHRLRVPDRWTLADTLRDKVGLTGTKLGCEQGVCGACTVLLDGASARSCLVLASQVDEADVVTIEGLTDASDAGRALQEAFQRHDALQCGFCTPGLLVTAAELLAEPVLDEQTVREALTGNLCRCTGYGGIVRAVLEVHERLGPVPLAGHPDRRGDLTVHEDGTAPVGTPAETPAQTSAPPSWRGPTSAWWWFVGAGLAAVAWRLLRWQPPRRRPVIVTLLVPSLATASVSETPTRTRAR